MGTGARLQGATRISAPQGRSGVYSDSRARANPPALLGINRRVDWRKTRPLAGHQRRRPPDWDPDWDTRRRG